MNSSNRIKAVVLMCVSSNQPQIVFCTLILVIQTAPRDSVYYTKMGVGTGGVVDMCTGEVVRARRKGKGNKGVVRASVRWVDARGGGSSHFSHLCTQAMQLEPERAFPLKAEVPAHAQRMSRLLAADKGAPCRVGRRVYEAGCVVRAGRREGVGQRWRKRHAQ